MPVIGFEGLARRNETVDVPVDYAGLGWEFARAAGTNAAASLDDGFAAALHGKAVGLTTDGMAGLAILEPGVFSLKSGHFAAGTTNNVAVTFSSFRDGVFVGSKAVVLDREDTVITFGHRFKNVDVVTISAGSDIAFDNLSLAIHPDGTGDAPAAPYAMSPLEAALIEEALAGPASPMLAGSDFL
jgi:hypothetical protein